MTSMSRWFVTFAVVIGLGLAAAGPVLAVSKCKAKVYSKTGTILVSASGVVGTLTWGDGQSLATRTFHNAATCVADGKAKNCTLGEPASARATTPPRLCTIQVKDTNGTCDARVKGCTPGDRGLYAKDTNGLVFAHCPGGVFGNCEITVPDGRRMQIGSLTNSEFPSANVIYYADLGCVGQASMDPAYGHNNQTVNAETRDGMLFYPADTAPAPTDTESFYSTTNGCFDTSYSASLVPALTLDISNYTPPYHIDDMP